MLAELTEKLCDEFEFDENHIEAVVYQIRQYAARVEIPGMLRVVQDPDDDKFIECAVVAGARWIVSGDRHLLNIGEYQGIRILNAQKLYASCGRRISITITSHPTTAPCYRPSLKPVLCHRRPVTFDLHPSLASCFLILPPRQLCQRLFVPLFGDGEQVHQQDTRRQHHRRHRPDHQPDRRQRTIG